MERQVLEQGITLPSTPMTAPTPLPAARTLPPEIPCGSAQQYQFTLPPNSAGAAKVMRRQRNNRQPAPASPTFCPILPNLETPSTSTAHLRNTTTSTTVTNLPIPASTLCYRRKREQQEREGTVVRKRYNRKAGTTCMQCRKERLSETHKQYYGSWWCKETSDVNFDEWVENLKAQGKGKRKKIDKE